MNKLDDAIHDALSEEDAELLARFDKDPPAVSQVLALTRGPLASLSWIFLVASAAAGIFGVFAGWMFATLTDLRLMLIWGAIAGFCVAILVTTRLWFFMSLQTNHVIRELKRLELQVARLAAARPGSPQE